MKKHIAPLLEADEKLVTKRSPKKVKASKVLFWCILITFNNNNYYLNAFEAADEMTNPEAR